MAIVDGRISLDTWEVNQPDDLSGALGGTADTEIFIQGTQSYGYYTTTTRAGLLYDAGSAQNWSNNTFYLWVNCGIAGLLDTKINGGLAVRFAGATVTDWFEVNVAGSDDYPTAVNGGWVMLVVDIEKAKTASDRTNGTPPATSAIRYVGISTITATTMPRMADNTWLDAMWRLPASTAGIRVEGQNTGSVDWTWADIVSASDTGAWGTAKNTTGGAIGINTPIQFGANDGVTHGFSDTNKLILWENWDVATSFYGLTVVGGSSVQSFELGIKNGTGVDATAAQGCVIAADANGERWFFDCDDGNIDACNLWGCTFIHGGDFQLDNANTSCISNSFLDCSSATQSHEFLRCSVVDANTADGVAFITSSDPSAITYTNFEFSDGHAIEVSATGTFGLTGNVFSSYGASGTNDAALYNNSGGSGTFNILGGVASPTVRDEVGSTSTVVNAVTIQLNDIAASSRVYILDTTNSIVLANTIEASTTFTQVYDYGGDVDITVRIRNASNTIKYKPFETTGVITSNGFSLTVNQELDE